MSTTPAPEAHHPRAEAHARLGGRFTVRVLEPSPPAITAPPFHADDPTVRASSNDRSVVSPVATGDLSWSEVVAAHEDPQLAAWCADRWLAAWRPLPACPVSYTDEVTDHLLVLRYVLGPWRAARSGDGGRRDLRWTRSGYGTPFCGDDRQLRVETGALVRQHRGEVANFAPDRLVEACVFAGVPDPGDLDPDTPLELGGPSGALLADWLGCTTLLFERARADRAARSRVWLDPDEAAVRLDLGDCRLRADLVDLEVTVDADVVLRHRDLVGASVDPVAVGDAALAAVLRSDDG